MATAPKVHVWDMDHTLIANDCDVSWKQFLVATGRAPTDDLRLVEHFFELYRQAKLDPDEFLAFQLREFVGRTEAEMAPLAEEHFRVLVTPRIYPEALAQVRAQRAAGERVLLCTATNRLIAAPLAKAFGFPELLATELELVDGRYTGRFAGAYCGGPGKLEHLHPWCARYGLTLADLAYYGDSSSDIPVLAAVGFPRVCNPMPKLRQHAEAQGWPIQVFTPPAGTPAT